MRAIQPTHRRRRFAAGIITASILALSLVGGSATAANSRILWIGSNLVDANGALIDADHDGVPDNNQKLIPTAVNAGFATAIPVQLKSGDNQTIAHVVFRFPASGELTSGLTITAVGGVDKAGCPTVDAPVSSITCNFDNLPGLALRSFFIVLNAPSQTFADADHPLLSAQATTNNENGSNLQLFTANSGTFNVQAADANGLSTFVKPSPGQLRQTFNTNGAAGANKLQTKVEFDQSVGGNLVSIAETDSGPGAHFLYTCPAGQSCQPVETTISITNDLSGAATEFGSPFLRVTLTALVPKTYTLSKAFVAHYGASAATPDWILFWNTKATKCGTNPATILSTNPACFQDATLSKPNADGFETVTLTVLMKHNGGARF